MLYISNVRILSGNDVNIEYGLSLRRFSLSCIYPHISLKYTALIEPS